MQDLKLYVDVHKLPVQDLQMECDGNFEKGGKYVYLCLVGKLKTSYYLKHIELLICNALECREKAIAIHTNSYSYCTNLGLAQKEVHK